MSNRWHRGPSRPARLPAVIRTIDDLHLLMNFPRAIKHLPRGGIPVAIAGLDSAVRDAFHDALVRYIRACGCGAGAAAFLVSVILLAAYVAKIAPEASWPWLAIVIAGGLFGALALTAAAKFLSLWINRLRFVGSCRHLIQSLQQEN